MTDTTELEHKRESLEAILQSLGRTLIAYSGGVDSAYLAWVAHRVLNQDMLALIADSPSLARAQFQDALAFVQEQGIPLETIQTSEMERPEYLRNDQMRCFHCKDELFLVMEDFAGKRGFQSIAYGACGGFGRTAPSRVSGRRVPQR